MTAVTVAESFDAIAPCKPEHRSRELAEARAQLEEMLRILRAHVDASSGSHSALGPQQSYVGGAWT
jgi:hypothetical protein